MKDKIYVIAGNRAEYDIFIRKKAMEIVEHGDLSISLSHFVFVHNPNQLRGIRPIHGYFVGSYHKRSDFQDLKDWIAIANNVPLKSLP